jgi:endonuclease YncB( thermonuclease family)
MRAIVSIAVMLVSGIAAAAPAEAAVVDVLTGDVIAIDDKQWHIAFILAPQIEHTCAAEAKLGMLARDKLAEFVAQGEMEIRPTEEYDFKHRVMAYVSINGEDVGEKMIAARLAQRYDTARPLCPGRSQLPYGEGVRRGWQTPKSLPPYPAAGIRH